MSEFIAEAQPSVPEVKQRPRGRPRKCFAEGEEPPVYTSIPRRRDPDYMKNYYLKNQERIRQKNLAYYHSVYQPARVYARGIVEAIQGVNKDPDPAMVAAMIHRMLPGKSAKK